MNHREPRETWLGASLSNHGVEARREETKKASNSRGGSFARCALPRCARQLGTGKRVIANVKRPAITALLVAGCWYTRECTWKLRALCYRCSTAAGVAS